MSLCTNLGHECALVTDTCVRCGLAETDIRDYQLRCTWWRRLIFWVMSK